MDGSTIIDTQAVYVPAGGNSATEVIWTPLFAGKRNLKVAVDPQNDVSEIFERMNNNATREGFNVFYFYDDLENGTGNWKHDGTVLHITGESPLDYINLPVYSNISYMWNETETGGFIPTDMEYHSFNNSFYTFEPAATVSIVFTLDNSASMSGKIDDLLRAFNYTIENMTDRDRIAIYTFNGDSDPSPYDPFDGSGGPILLTDLPSNDDDDGFLELGGNYTCPIHNQGESGRTVAKHLATLIDHDGGVGTPLWETVNSAIDLAYSAGRGIPAVVAMTDGADSGPPDGAPVNEGPEGPWDPDPPDTDFNGNDANTDDDWTVIKDYDVCNSPIRVYTVGLGVPGGKTGSAGNALNETALSSNGTFYYTDDPTQLLTIYEDILGELTAATQTRSARVAKTFFTEDFEVDLSRWVGVWVRSTDQSHGAAYSAKSSNGPSEGTFTTINIDLSSATAATLTFWYRLDDTETNDFQYAFYDGSGWNLMGSLGGGAYSTWIKETVAINLTTYGISTFKIRFTSNLGGGENVWLDDVLVDGDEDAGPSSKPGKTERSLWGAGDRNMTTESFDLLGVTSATLSFYQKYDIKSALNGLVLQIGTYNGTTWSWKYLIPKQPYTSNYDTSKSRLDDYGTDMRWCFNGVSGNGLYIWDYIEVDISNYTGQTNLRIRFLYMWSAWGDGGYYFVDDVKLRVVRNDTTAVTSASDDQWAYVNSDSHSGSYSWWIGDPSTGHLTGGLDNSLYTRPIDLTNARNATFSAYFKFNINITESGGRPPDGFRVEISSDNGISWKTINLGVRSCWGVSGNDSDATDGFMDGKSYTGLDPDGDRWIEASTLARLNVDITGWAGSVIMLRFRVVTASDDNPYFDNHYEWGGAGYGGIYMDDVIISGFSLLG
jgi:hypothetical protein